MAYEHYRDTRIPCDVRGTLYSYRTLVLGQVQDVLGLNGIDNSIYTALLQHFLLIRVELFGVKFCKFSIQGKLLSSINERIERIPIL